MDHEHGLVTAGADGTGAVAWTCVVWPVAIGLANDPDGRSRDPCRPGNGQAGSGTDLAGPGIRPRARSTDRMGLDTGPRRLGTGPSRGTVPSPGTHRRDPRTGQVSPGPGI